MVSDSFAVLYAGYVSLGIYFPSYLLDGLILFSESFKIDPVTLLTLLYNLDISIVREQFSHFGNV